MNTMQLMKMQLVAVRKRGGIRWINSCRAAKRNQTVKKSKGTRDNPPTGRAFKRLASTDKWLRVNGPTTEYEVDDLEE